MASVYDLKPRFQNLLRPLAARLVADGWTANGVTLAGLGLSAVWGLLIWLTGAYWLVLVLVPVVLLVRMALNALDGMLAREYGQASPEGIYLNELTDVASDAVLYLPFMAIAGLSGVLVGLVVAAGIITEMAGILALMIGVDRRYDGPFGKSDRAVFWAVLAVIAGLGWGGVWLNAALVAALGLSGWTAWRRAYLALAEPE